MTGFRHFQNPKWHNTFEKEHQLSSCYKWCRRYKPVDVDYIVKKLTSGDLGWWCVQRWFRLPSAKNLILLENGSLLNRHALSPARNFSSLHFGDWWCFWWRVSEQPPVFRTVLCWPEPRVLLLSGQLCSFGPKWWQHRLFGWTIVNLVQVISFATW